MGEAVNINDEIKVTLKPLGKEIVLAYYEGVPEGFRLNLARMLSSGELTLPVWEFAAIFGNHLSLGLDLPFESEFEVKQ